MCVAIRHIYLIGMFWYKYLKFLLFFAEKNEASSVSDILSKPFINRDIARNLSQIYKDYSFRIEIKEINGISIVCARVRCGESKNQISVKHWYVYKEGSGRINSWCLN